MSRQLTSIIGLLAFMIGIGLGTLFGISALLLTTALVPMIVVRRWWIVMLVVTVLVSLGIGRGVMEPKYAPANDISHWSDNERHKVTGRVAAFPDRRFDHDRFVIEVKSVDDHISEGRLLLRTFINRKDIDYGDVLNITGKIEKPEPIDEFRYDTFLAKDYIYSVMRYSQHWGDRTRAALASDTTVSLASVV